MAFDEKHPPRNDVVFSIMFGKKELFQTLIEAITGKKVNIDNVVSQATVLPECVEQSVIIPDTQGSDSDGSTYSADMQTTYYKRRIQNRTVYYGSKLIANQNINKSQYEDLHNIVVSFLFPSKAKKEGIEIIQLKDGNGNLYSELLTLYNVYVPSTAISGKGNIKIFSEFFIIDSEEKMEKFEEKYRNNRLANRLILEYNKAIARNDLANIERREYFMQKLTEADVAKAKQELEETKSKSYKLLLKNGIPVSKIASDFGVSESEVLKVVAET